VKLPVNECCGNQEKLTGSELEASAVDGSGEDCENGESARGRGLAWLGQIPFLHAEVRAINDRFTFRVLEGGLEILEVDGLQRLVDVKLARFSIEADAVPIEDAVGGVAILLNLDDDISSADCVDAAAGDEDAIPGAYLDSMNGLLHGADRESLLESVPRDTGAQAGEDVAIAVTIEDVPHFGLWLSIKTGRYVGWGMNLHGEALLRVEELEEEGKAR
jgi:hypothetical protein